MGLFDFMKQKPPYEITGATYSCGNSLEPPSAYDDNIMIVAGASAYARIIDFEKISKIATRPRKPSKAARARAAYSRRSARSSPTR